MFLLQTCLKAVSFLLSFKSHKDKPRPVIPAWWPNMRKKREQDMPSARQGQRDYREETGGCLLFFFWGEALESPNHMHIWTHKPLRHSYACTYKWRCPPSRGRQFGTSFSQLCQVFFSVWGQQSFEGGFGDAGRLYFSYITVFIYWH